MGEFDWIARYFVPLAAGVDGALGLKDDAALIPIDADRSLAVTVDAIVAGRHFLPHDRPDHVARKLLRVNLSDLAAMGATPAYAFLTTAWPLEVEESWIARFADGLKADLDRFGLGLGGGDTVATDGPATFTLTALGWIDPAKAIRRSGARVGDRIWVSGTIGDGAFGLRVATGEADWLERPLATQLLERYRLPEPRLGLGQTLAGTATAGLDVSDGLLQDLGHLARASGVALEISSAAIPCSAAASRFLATGAGTLIEAVTGGDDYELAFTAPDEPAIHDRLAVLAVQTATPVTAIGHVVEEDPSLPAIRFRDIAGGLIAVDRAGFRHF